MISPQKNAAFVADMERVLDIYKRPYDVKFPVVCYDEMPRQLLEEVREIQPMRPGQSERVDYEYRRMGTCNVLMASEPLRGWRMTDVTPTKTAKDWAFFTEKIAAAYPDAEKIILVEDNLNTHKPASWYEVFSPEKAKALMDKFELVYTPKHGSWLNMAEIELNVVSAQCLKKRIASIDEMKIAVNFWERERNEKSRTINWQFTTDDARVKLHRLYPSFQV